MPVPSGAARSIFCYNRPVELTLSQLLRTQPVQPRDSLTSGDCTCSLRVARHSGSRFAGELYLATAGPANRMSSVAFFSIAAWLHTRLAPPIKQPPALEAVATRFCVPQENRARKRRKFSYVLRQLYNSRRARWF